MREVQVDNIPASVLSVRQNRTLSVFEDRLKKQIDHDRLQPKTSIQWLRKQGCVWLHWSPVLMMVVVLNCIDCLLVLSEIMLDVYFVNAMIQTAENTMESFNQLLMDKYPETFGGLGIHNTHKFYNLVLRSHMTWDNDTLAGNNNHTIQGDRVKREMNVSMSNIYLNDTTPVTTAKLMLFKKSDTPDFLIDHVHSLEEKAAHILHKASIVILATLVLYTVLKIICHGLEFVKHKLEVFDGIVVFVSFTLDICYINGLTNYPVESFIVILIIMIPWRILRVLNSLVIAIKDNSHFLLKLMYKKIRYQRERIEYLEHAALRNQNLIHVLTKVCEGQGLNPGDIQTHLDVFPAPATDEKKERSFSHLSACFSRQMSIDAPFLPVCEKVLKEWQHAPKITEECEETDATPSTTKTLPENKPLLKVKRTNCTHDQSSDD